MDRLIVFWDTYRNEILTTFVAIVGIHLVTSLGGFVGKKRGGAKRVEGTGFEQPSQAPKDPA